MDKEEKKQKTVEKGWPIGKLPPSSEWPSVITSFITVIGFLVVLFFIPAIIIGIVSLSYNILQNFFNSQTGVDSFANIRNSLLLLTAIVGAIGIPLYIWRTIIASSQAKTARDRAYTELFTKAIEQLGAEKPMVEGLRGEDGKPITDEAGRPLTHERYVPNIEVRIGAIYALERIMKDSDKDAPAIVDTLAAYIRENCDEAEDFDSSLPEQDDYENVSEWVDAIREVVGDFYKPKQGTIRERAHAFREGKRVNRVDIKTALTVLGRRPAHLKTDNNRPDLRGVNFQGWDLSNFDLSYLDLEGAQMQGVVLNNANMQEAYLVNSQMQGADLIEAQIQRAVLKQACLQGAELENAHMQGADLTYAKMQWAGLYQVKMLEAVLAEASMQGTVMIEA